MKNIKLLMAATTLLLASCGLSNKTESNSKTEMDSLTSAAGEDKTLITKMNIASVADTASPVSLQFTVYNYSDTALTFCKWHTPFEPLMSKYLDVTDDTGKEIAYKGPMAKRIMPPPAESYITVKAGDSITVSADLKKAYAIEKSGTYHVKYNSTGISGLVVKDSASFSLR